MIVVGGVVVWWGLNSVSHTWQPGGLDDQRKVAAERSLAAAIGEVESASQSLDARMRGAGVGEDLANGWEDLRGDALSVLREMSRRPDLDHVRAFAARVDGFWATYAPSSGIGPDTPEWRRFESAFLDAIGTREAVLSGMPTANES